VAALEVRQAQVLAAVLTLRLFLQVYRVKVIAAAHTMVAPNTGITLVVAHMALALVTAALILVVQVDLAQ
jgi:hypothetical protein